MTDRGIRIAIDATNLNMGGGRSHILSILENFNPSEHNISKIVVYGSNDLLGRLPNVEWLDKKSHRLLNASLIFRYLWLFFYSYFEFSKNCDVLFSPSGLYFGRFKPFITMSRNMMLFDKSQLNSQAGMLKIKLLISRWMNISSIKRSSGVIFISDYAQTTITNELQLKQKKTIKINHGISDRFKIPSNFRKHSLDNEHPLRILYVSHVYSYKHPWNVVRAVSKLKDDGFDVSLDLVGGGNFLDIKRLESEIDRVDIDRQYIKYHGNQPYERIHEYYTNSNIFAYASTCENMPNILLEAMSSSLPIASSKSDPMPEFLEDGGIYFDSLDVDSIYNSLLEYLISPKLRELKGEKAYQISQKYSWKVTSRRTFDFVQEVCESYH